MFSFLFNCCWDNTDSSPLFASKFLTCFHFNETFRVPVVIFSDMILLDWISPSSLFWRDSVVDVFFLLNSTIRLLSPLRIHVLRYHVFSHNSGVVIDPTSLISSTFYLKSLFCTGLTRIDIQIEFTNKKFTLPFYNYPKSFLPRLNLVLNLSVILTFG